LDHQQFTERKLSPTSAWTGDLLHAEALEELTLFLRQAGAPLDNNVCEGRSKKQFYIARTLFL